MSESFTVVLTMLLYATPNVFPTNESDNISDMENKRLYELSKYENAENNINVTGQCNMKTFSTTHNYNVFELRETLHIYNICQDS